MALSNDDLFACSRGGQTYNVTAKQIKEYADESITSTYIQCYGNIVTQGDFFLTEGGFSQNDINNAHLALFNDSGNAYFCDKKAGFNTAGVCYAQDFTKVVGPQTITIDEAGVMSNDLTGGVSLFDLIDNLTTRIEQLEADHASAMNNMEDDNGSSTY